MNKPHYSDHNANVRQEFINEAWRRIAGLPEEKKEVAPSLEELKKTEWFPEFERLMRNRMVMGAFRYELLNRQNFSKYNLPMEAIKRINRYIQDGNTEHLVDAANLCGIASLKDNHPNKHFKSIDDGPHSDIIIDEELDNNICMDYGNWTYECITYMDALSCDKCSARRS